MEVSRITLENTSNKCVEFYDFLNFPATMSFVTKSWIIIPSSLDNPIFKETDVAQFVFVTRRGNDFRSW